MRKILWMVGLILNSFAFGQVSEGFDDADFTKQPTWIGDTNRFLINSDLKLQSKIKSTTDTAELYTSCGLLYNTFWEYTVQMNMDPSSTNYLRIVLNGDFSLQHHFVQGYYLQIGESGTKDAIQFYKRKNGINTKIWSSPAIERSNNDTLIWLLRVECDERGVWSFFQRENPFENWKELGNCFASALEFGNSTGIIYRHTSTRSDKLIIDNIQIASLLEGPSSLAQFRQVSFNEIMADPSPSMGLPEHEYIELRNNGPKSIALENWTLEDLGSRCVIGKHFINPGGIAIVCAMEDSNIFKQFGQVIPLDCFPSLNNTSEKLQLKNERGNLIDEIQYELSWYKNNKKSSGGYSLCKLGSAPFKSNFCDWSVSNDSLGGSPGRENTTPPHFDLPLQVSNALLVAPNKLQIKLSTYPDTSFVLNQSSVTINGQAYLRYKITSDDFRGYEFEFTENWNPQQNYAVQFTGIGSCKKGKIEVENLNLTLQSEEDGFHVVINEIMADPYPSHGLPTAEYIELQNLENEKIELHNWLLTVGNSKFYLQNLSIAALDFVILCHPRDSVELSKFGSVYCVPLALPNGGATVSLYNGFSNIIDSTTYTLDSYHHHQKKNGGYSLERIDPWSKCNTMQNWTASNDPAGGSPNHSNSAMQLNTDLQKIKLLQCKLQSKNSVLLSFSKTINHQGLTPFQFYLVGPKMQLTFANSISLNVYSNEIELKFTNPIAAGQYQVVASNLAYCMGNDTTLIGSLHIMDQPSDDFDVRLSELMIDPNPNISLPSSEFIELYHAGDSLVLNVEFKLVVQNDTNTIIIDSMEANACLLFVAADDVEQWKGYKIHPIDSWPGLPNEKFRIEVLNMNNISLSSLDFDLRQVVGEKPIDGKSYTKTHQRKNCNDQSLWFSSAVSSGGSPGWIDPLDYQDGESIRLSLKNFTSEEQSIRLTSNHMIAGSKFELEISPSLGNVKAEMIGKEIFVKTTKWMEANILYQIHIKLVTCSGLWVDTTISILFNDEIASTALQFSEILFNPFPYGSDFVELYNTGALPIDLSEFYIKNCEEQSTSYSICSSPWILMPNNYAVICSDSENLKSNYTVLYPNQVIEIDKLPELADQSGCLQLIRKFKQVDMLSYSENQHVEWLDDFEGRSLERRSFKLKGSDPSNWISANDAVGLASPTYRNSQHSEIVNIQPAFHIKNKTIRTQSQNGGNILEIQYQLNEQIERVKFNIYELGGRFVTQVGENQTLSGSGSYYWDLGVEGQLVDEGTYILEIWRQGHDAKIRKIRLPFMVLHTR